MTYEIPRIPASAGALIWDEQERLLILKPTYKKGWTIPGGQVDADGESPWDACRRETREECGLEVTDARLVCVDFRPKRPDKPGGVRFVFDCGSIGRDRHARITLQEDEIEDYQFAGVDLALELLSGPLSRRVSQCAGVDCCVYLEDGRPLPAVA